MHSKIVALLLFASVNAIQINLDQQLVVELEPEGQEI